MHLQPHRLSIAHPPDVTAVELRVDATGPTNFGPTVGEFQGTNKVFYNKGTVKTTLVGTGGPNTGPGGGLAFSGTGEFTKGTGKFKGAKGKFTFEGTQPANSTVTTFTVTGTIKY